MENSLNLSELAFYLLKTVQVQFKDATVKRGRFLNYDLTAGLLQIDEDSVPINSVMDIAYVAAIDDFHTYKGYGEIGNVKFSAEDLHPDFALSDLLYGEFTCTVACHLYLKDGEICAKDIRLLEKRHTLNYSCVKEQAFLYRYDNGAVVVGTVTGGGQEYRLVTSDGESRPLALEHVVDVTKAPCVNDYLYVRVSADSAEHSGLVSAATGTTIVLIDDQGGPAVIDLTQAVEMRYRGTVQIKKASVNGKAAKKVMITVGSSRGDAGYLCKAPYARNPEAIKCVKDGDIVSFIAGVNDRYCIAKDVDILQSEGEQKAEERSGREYYGIILTVDFSKENGYGYVGNRFISKACGKSVPGHARFNRNQLDFKLEYNKTFIVKYTATENANARLRIIDQISLHQVLDATKYGVIEVSDDGEINAIPLYKAGASYFENRDVDVYCTGGTVVSGKLYSHSDLGVNLCKGQNNGEDGTFIPYSDIEDIRIVGTVSQFYPNGTGYVDNSFFFHINEMEQSVDAQYIHRGAQVSFRLRNARKGNHVDCGAIRVLPEKRIDAYVLAYQNQSYTVVNAEKYGRSVRFFDNAYEVPFSGYNTLRDLGNEDYHAILTIQRKNGLEECTNIRTLESRPKLRYGIVTALNREKNTVSITSSSNYRKKPGATTFPLSMQSRTDRLSNLERKDYPVLYYTTMQSGVPTATVTWVEMKNVLDKCRFGYIEQFFEDRKFGWITPEEYIDVPWKKRPKNFGVYCRLSSFAEIPEPGKLYQPGFILRVCYTLDFDRKIDAHNPKPPAKQVWILESVKRIKPSPSPEPEPKPVPKPDPVQKKKRIETLHVSELGKPASEMDGTDLEKNAPAAAQDGENYVYGLINIFTTRYALINTQYYNRKYTPEAAYDMNQTVYFNPEETIITPEAKLKTGHSYLVRYVRKGTVTNPTTGLEQATVDSACPIEVVYTFSQKQCASIALDGEMITIEYVEGDASPNDDAPEVAFGESLYFKLKGGNVYLGAYSGEDGDAYFLSGGKTIEKSAISRLFRFGIVSALSTESGMLTINNYFDVGLNVAEPQMVSILKNQKGQVHLHVMYSCAGGKITEVCRISKRCLTCIAWEPGTVTEWNSDERSISIDATVIYYLSVMSAGINTYVNNRSILNRAVFVKQVSHPYRKPTDLEAEIITSALDVRCQEEELKIQYDEGKDIYMGYRNATISFPLHGSGQFLHSKVGETVLVSFRVSADLHGLEGYVDDDAGEPEEDAKLIEEFDSSHIQREALSMLLLQREDTEQPVGGKVQLGPDSTQEQVKRAVDSLISKSKHLAAIKVATKYPAYEVLPNLEGLLRTEIQNRCMTVGLDTNSYSGEQAYYVATVLQYPTSARARGRFSNGRFSKEDYLYRLFAPDFESREHYINYLRSNHPAQKANLVNLFRKPCLQISEFVTHIVLLNQSNLDKICNLIRSNHQLSEEIISYAKEVDDLISAQDISEVIHALQDRYLRDKRRFTDRIVQLMNNQTVCSDLKTLLTSMQSRFLKLICQDDRTRFESLLKICTDVLGYVNLPGFTQQEQMLRHAYREVDFLEEDILAHPCKESLEILISAKQFDPAHNILTAVKQEIFTLLNLLYKDVSKPKIRVKLNKNSILPESKTFWIIVENGGRNENLQPAENIQIELESFTLGFMPQQRVHLKQNKIFCGEQLAVEVELALSGEATGVLEFGWTARYEYITGFQSDGSTRKVAFTQKYEQSLQLQIDSESAERKNYDADNPYRDPARGQPLIGKEMFFGREAEKKEILDCICTTAGEKKFIPGSAVIIYGQKKSGKTSLVNQIRNYIKDDASLSDKAIFLNFSNILSDNGGVQQLDFFQRTFYAAIMSRFKHEVKRCHPDVAQMLRENDIQIPNLLRPDYRDTWPAVFDAFFQDFYNVDGGRHSILLFMDEFTLLSTTILKVIQKSPEKAYLNNIPNFIKTFSQYGFIQIIIGHESMMRALATLGVLNHTAEFAKSIEISALDDDAARALVTSPMRDRFGYNVYDSELGKQAVERLLDLSGRNPAYLMRLCDRMFTYFTDPQKCPGTQLLLSDVNAMVREYTGELLLSDFDILLMEDGDDAMEAEKRKTYGYLKTAALLSLSSYDKRTADISEINRVLSRDFDYTSDQIEKTRNILEERHVISVTSGGRVKINTGLFSEFIYQKNGLG